jgi:hypothetical protein
MLIGRGLGFSGGPFASNLPLDKEFGWPFPLLRLAFLPNEAKKPPEDLPPPAGTAAIDRIEDGG